MSDLAVLGTRFVTENADKVHRDLDDYRAKAVGAAGGADQAAAGSRRLSDAMLKMLASIEKSTKEIAELTRQQKLVAQAVEAAAAAETRAAAVNTRYSMSFTQVTASANQAAASIDKAGDAATKAASQAKAASVHFDALYDAANHDFAQQYVRQMGAVSGGHVAASKTSKQLTMATLDLSRQFADIGVSAAMGMNPLMILIQQGPQIADRLALMKMEGIGLGDALRGIAAAAAPVMAVLGPMIVTAGALGAMFLMLHHEAKNSLGNVAKDLELTEAQMKRVKDTGVTMGDTLQAVFKTAGQLIYGSLKGPIDDLRDAFGAWYADLVANTMKEVKAIVSVFAGGYGAIKAVWSQLPAAMADIAVSAANGVISAIEAMINKAIDSVNGLMAALKPAMSLGVFGPVGQGLAGAMRPIGHVELGGLANPNEGAAARVMTDAAAAYAKDAQNAGKIIDKASDLFLKNLRDITEKRIRKEAGDAAKTPKGPAAPRDMSDERAAQIAQLVAQSKADELQAQLALTEDVRARAELEQRLVDMQLAVQLAQLDKQAATIKEDVTRKRISESEGAELLLQLESVRITQATVAALKAQLIERNAARQAIRDENAIRAAGIRDQIDLLDAQRDSARFGFERREIDLQILEAQQTIERLKLQEIVATTASTSAEYKIAEARLKVLDAIHGAQTDAAKGTPQDAFDRVTRAMEDVARAFEARDWNALVTSIVEAIGTLKEAFKKGGSAAGKIGAVAGLGQIIGGAIGGTAGSTISGASSGAMAGLTLSGGNPIVAAIGAALGGLGGFLGGKSEEKQRRQAEELARQQAEHQRAIDLTNAKREQEITLLELTGKASEALKLRREAELAAMDATLQATQLKIWALQDEQAAAEARAALDIRLMDAQGRASESLALKRAREIAAANDNERGVLREIFAAEDVASARDALSAAYERESSALQATIDKFRAFSEGLKRFRDSLYSGPAAMLSPVEQYKAARSAFDTTSSLAAGGDEDAIRDLESVSQAYLDASKAYYASSEAYFADLERVRAAVTATQGYAASQVNTAEAQLSALNASVAGILGVQNAVLSVKDALAAYQAAILAQKAVANDNALTTPTANDNTPSLPQAPDWSSYLRHYPDVLAEFNRLSPNNIRNNLKIDYNPEAFAKWHYEVFGKGEGRTPFAMGGSFTVGGSGGTDSQAFGPMALTPGEIVNVRRPGDVAADNAALREGLDGVRAELRAVRGELQAANNQRGEAATQTIKKLDQLLDAADDGNRATREQGRAAA
jgi:hypothetical protein